jgi:Flp pilus assembly protein TadG
MIRQAIALRFFRALSAFGRSRSGNVATIFALAIVPIIGFVGSAIDYSRASSTRAAMQSALDATALMLSKSAASLNADQVSTKATDYFLSLMNSPDANNIKVTAVYSDTNGSQILLNGSGAVDANFMKLFGYDSIPLTVNSTVKWGTTRLRVALALDNTGSMSRSNKMPTLKTAAKNLLTQLQNASRVNGDVYVSIVPFAKDVNIGKSANWDPDWIDFTLLESDWQETHGKCSVSDRYNRPITTRTTCTNNNNRGTWTPDPVPASVYSNWTGCVTDRGANNSPKNDLDISVTPPVKNVTESRYPAENYKDCPERLMPLSYDWAALKNKIDAMTPAGNTNITIGLVWAWQTLVNNGPFPAPAKSSNYEYQDVIILLTDGDNTQNRFTSRQSDIDARTNAACTAAKNAKITMYTVLVMEGTQSLLQDCASDTSKYFYITSADQLITTFDKIGTALSNLRIAE